VVPISSDGRQQVAQHVVEIRLDNLQLGCANPHVVAEIVDHGGIGRRIGSRLNVFAKRFADSPWPGRELLLAHADGRPAAAGLCRRTRISRDVSVCWVAIAAAVVGENNHVCCASARWRATGIDRGAARTIPPHASIGDEERP